MGPYSRARWVHMLAARQRRVRTYLARRRALAVAAALRTGMLSISTVRPRNALAVQLAVIASLAGNARARSASTLRLYSSLRTRMPPMWGTVANSSVDTSAAS